MTKAELEDDFDKCFDKNTSPTGGGYEADWTDRNGLWNDFKPAVEIFVKQESIEYAKFRDDYRHIESMNWKHNVTDKIGMVTWVGASDDKIYEAYKEGKQLLRWIEDPNHPDNMLQKHS